MNKNCKNNITCPYCGYEDKNSWEFDYDEETQQDCGRCGKEFNVSREISVTYSTSRIECKKGEHKYKTEDYHITKSKFISHDNWEDIPEKDWKYFRIEVCELCDDKEYVDITKEEYHASKIKV